MLWSQGAVLLEQAAELVLLGYGEVPVLQKIGKKRGFPATCRKFLDKGCEKLDQGVDQFEVLADQGLDLLRR